MTPNRLSLKHAAREQVRLAGAVEIRPLPRMPRVVAAVDAAYPRGLNLCLAAAVVVGRDGFELLESSLVVSQIAFPYVPGYLSFREAPPLLRALRALETPFDALLVDGQGIAHPRGLGLASHIGVLLGVPAIGCAKKRLVGDYAAPKEEKGSFSPLVLRGRRVGAVVRTRARVKPVFVSPGHLTDPDSALKVVLDWAGRFRIPEPLRAAHGLAAKYSRSLAPLMAKGA